MKYLAFDIEIARTLPEDETEWKAHRPLGITCAAAASSDGELWNWWASDNGKFTEKMTQDQCLTIVFALQDMSRDGYTILTWNGLGFDFGILAEESQSEYFCKELALNHIDMMFHFHCAQGYHIGLDAAAKGMGLPGKPAGMSRPLAPELWAKGEYHRVLDYVSWDVKTMLAVAEAVDVAGRLGWTARTSSWMFPKWLTVQEAMALPEPETSWISGLWPRDKFYGWTGYKPANT